MDALVGRRTIDAGPPLLERLALDPGPGELTPADRGEEYATSGGRESGTGRLHQRRLPDCGAVVDGNSTRPVPLGYLRYGGVKARETGASGDDYVRLV